MARALCRRKPDRRHPSHHAGQRRDAAGRPHRPADLRLPLPHQLSLDLHHAGARRRHRDGNADRRRCALRPAALSQARRRHRGRGRGRRRAQERRGRRSLINPVSEWKRAMKSTSGGEAIVNGLVAHGVDTVFGLPGAQIYGLFDAFHQAQLKVIGARHEQACGYMAYGYARSTGRPGVFSVVPGPGVLNAGAALLTAFGSNEPVLCLTGQVPTQFFGKGRGHLHEMPDQLATLRTFVKWAERIEYPDAAPALVSRAFQEMLSGRRGPVALEMPWDVFTQRAETGAAKTFDLFPAPRPDPERVKNAAALIGNSRTPMIFVGSGAIDAGEEILELAELIDAPVVAFRSGRGIVSNAHELGLTMAAAYRLWGNTDLMIGIGT